MSLFAPIFAALGRANARYVVVGGVATVLHGYARLTADVDIIIDFAPAEAEKALRALGELGLRPRAPVAITDLADAEKRRTWVHDKGMMVFSLWDPLDPMREVDIFVEHPIPFDELYGESEIVVLGNESVRIASIPHLIQLKRLADRPEDRIDIEALTAILEARAAR
jgi:hypothetical protein